MYTHLKLIATVAIVITLTIWSSGVVVVLQGYSTHSVTTMDNSVGESLQDSLGIKDQDSAQNGILPEFAYLNEDMGIVFEHPSDVMVEAIDAERVAIKYSGTEEELPLDDSIFAIFKYHGTMADYISEYTLGDPLTFVQTEDYQLGDYSFKKITITTSIGIDTISLFASINGDNYIISYHDVDEGHYFNQLRTDILSTLDFIQDDYVEVPGWEVYTNYSDGYHISYPTQWHQDRYPGYTKSSPSITQFAPDDVSAKDHNPGFVVSSRSLVGDSDDIVQNISTTLSVHGPIESIVPVNTLNASGYFVSFDRSKALGVDGYVFVNNNQVIHFVRQGKDHGLESFELEDEMIASVSLFTPQGSSILQRLEVDNAQVVLVGNDFSAGSIYFTQSYKGVKLLSDVPLATTVYELQGTNNDDVVLLTTGFGDAGYSLESYYYMDVISKSVMQVLVTNRSTFWVVDGNGDKSELALSISNACDGNSDYTSSKDVILDYVTVNGAPSDLIASEVLVCDYETSELGPYYNPNIQFTLAGVARDLSTLYAVVFDDGSDKQAADFDDVYLAFEADSDAWTVVDGIPSNLLSL